MTLPFDSAPASQAAPLSPQFALSPDGVPAGGRSAEGPPGATSVAGSPPERVDGRLKVTGAARYTGDIALENLAHAVLITSTIANGRIRRFDTAEAERAPGVLAVLTPFNAPKIPGAQVRRRNNKQKPPDDRRIHLLQEATIFYSGQPIGVVVAETRTQALYAASLVDIRYTAQPPASVLAEHVAEAFTPRDEDADTTQGDAGAGLEEGSVQLEEHYVIPVETHNALEPHVTVAVWNDSRHLTLYDATQGVFDARERIAGIFELPPANVRVISHFIGGGFGSKGPVWSHVALAALAAREAGRPVRLELTRAQMFGPVGFRPETRQTVSLAAHPDGTLTALRQSGLMQTSMFDDYVEDFCGPARMLYACPNIATSLRMVRLHAGTPSYMRAPGKVSGMFPLESAMDELAYRLDIDPLELRLRNHADSDPMSGCPWSSKSLRECYAAGAERFGWARRSPQPRSMRDGGELVGLGMASATYPTERSAASARCCIFADGHAVVRSGTQDIGTGTYTVMAQLAAEVLGLPLAQVRAELGDTTLPEAPESGGSQTTASVGSAVFLAAQALRRKLLALAAADPHSALFGAAEGEVEAREGGLVLTRDPSLSESYAGLLARHNLPQVEAEVKAEPGDEVDRFAMHAFGAHFAEVRVDPELGTVRLARYTGAFAAGRIINQRTARNQFRGGIVWGIGMALQEQTITDARYGRIVNADLAEYYVPVNADIPALDILFVDEHDPHVNPIGAKGIGEIGIVGAAAAIANAVYHATGKRIRELPITLDKLL